MPKATTPTMPGVRHAQRHNPLSDDLVASGPLRTKSKKRKGRADEDENHSYVDAKSSRRILQIGQVLAEEELEEHTIKAPNAAFAFDSRIEEDAVSEDEQQHQDEDEGWGDENDEVVEEVVRTCTCIITLGHCSNISQELDPNDLDLFNKFMPSKEDPLLRQFRDNDAEESQGTNLADLILEKIAAHEAAQVGQPAILGPGEPQDAIELPEKVVDVYSK